MSTRRTLKPRLADDGIRIGPHFAVSFQRTLRIPDDGREHPLPPGLGRFPLRRVKDYAATVPESWRERGGLFLPMYQSEALWLSFDGAYWSPNAVKVAIGGVNAISGDPFDLRLRRGDRQDYVVCPDQPWLDGINAGNGFIRQFVAAPLGSGETVEGQVTGKEREGGIQIACFEPKPGRFVERDLLTDQRRVLCSSASLEMGLGVGGRMTQKIYPDDYGPHVWDRQRVGSVWVHIANSLRWAEITGEPPPSTPVDAEAYTRAGLPWFKLYDEEEDDVGPAPKLTDVKPSVARLDVPAAQLVGLRH